MVGDGAVAVESKIEMDGWMMMVMVMALVPFLQISPPFSSSTWICQVQNQSSLWGGYFGKTDPIWQSSKGPKSNSNLQKMPPPPKWWKFKF